MLKLKYKKLKKKISILFLWEAPLKLQHFTLLCIPFLPLLIFIISIVVTFDSAFDSVSQVLEMTRPLSTEAVSFESNSQYELNVNPQAHANSESKPNPQPQSDPEDKQKEKTLSIYKMVSVFFWVWAPIIIMEIMMHIIDD